jgi:uncharacterized protein YggE
MPETPTPGPAERAPATVQYAPVRAPLGPFAVTVLAIVVAIVVVGAIGFAGAAIGRGTKSGSPATVTVTGTGTVQGTPNEVQFTIGVQTVAGTAPGALHENDARMSQLERVLTKEGVAKKDLATSDLSIYENTNQYGVLTGFTVQDTLDVTMFSVKKAGVAIEAAARQAGNGIVFNGITLSISNDSKLLVAARARAMHDALSAAKSDASGGGASVGSIVRITDQETSTTPPPIIPYANALSAVHAGVPLEAGQQPVTVQVTVVYALNG